MELGNALFGNSRGSYKVDRQWQEMFVEMLDQMGFDGYGELNNQAIKNPHIKKIISTNGEEFYRWENDTFVLMPYYWGEDEEIKKLPNFLFKQTGFSISWYKYALRDSYMNHPLVGGEIQAILQLCLTSIREGQSG